MNALMLDILVSKGFEAVLAADLSMTYFSRAVLADKIFTDIRILNVTPCSVMELFWRAESGGLARVFPFNLAPHYVSSNPEAVNAVLDAAIGLQEAIAGLASLMPQADRPPVIRSESAGKVVFWWEKPWQALEVTAGSMAQVPLQIIEAGESDRFMKLQRKLSNALEVWR